MSSENTEISRIEASVNEIFTYLPDYNVLICRNHGYAIKFGQVRYHLDTKHIIRPEIRTEITDYIADRYSGSFRLPTGKIERISELPVHKKLKYRLGCSYLCQSRMTLFVISKENTIG